MTPVTDALLQEMTKTIIKKVDPLKIILFGSYALGNPKENSDIDLLIIEEKPFGIGRNRLHEIRTIRRALSRFRVPKDILLYSSDETAKWKNSSNHIVGRCLKEGLVLYERH